MDGDEESKVDVYHAWIVEDLEGGRVRILTQESQSMSPVFIELKEPKSSGIFFGGSAPE